jgi:hypothetical protein
VNLRLQLCFISNGSCCYKCLLVSLSSMQYSLPSTAALHACTQGTHVVALCAAIAIMLLRLSVLVMTALLLLPLLLLQLLLLLLPLCHVLHMQRGGGVAVLSPIAMPCQQC